MANKTLFKSLTGKLIPATDAMNEERAQAYAFAKGINWRSMLRLAV